ncbi:MAG: hypothetical protein GX605_06305 [Chloroflexi bacterium]|nr:hypothetical protein [Chloroflexota bacterium]
MQRRRNYQLTLWVMVALLLLVPALSASASGPLRYRHFPETGKTVGGAFLDFFDRYGGVSIFGYPITNEFLEGGTTVQYFQRARFEWWPGNPAPYQVQLGLVGSQIHAPDPAVANWTTPGRSDQQYFPQTGHAVSGAFLSFYRNHGALTLFGYPISEAYQVEGGAIIQWFQRARLEVYPGDSRVYMGNIGEEWLNKTPKWPVSPPSPQPPVRSRHFPETGQVVSDEFLTFWETKGGAAVFGYPISDRFTRSGLTVQYFQRARFELHPEQPEPYRVQLGLIGSELYGPPDPAVPNWTTPWNPQHRYFAMIGHIVSNAFLQFFQAHGGVDIFGYPLTEAKNEAGAGTLVQWFQRAKMEWKPGNPPGQQVQLAFIGQASYSGSGVGQWEPIRGFGKVWRDNPTVRDGLGLATAQQTVTWMAEEPFQTGHMLWRQDTRAIYVLKHDGTWKAYDENWESWRDREKWGYVPPSGLFEPVRGFGKVWMNYLSGPSGPLGWAKSPERGFWGVAQPFVRGLMLWNDNRTIFVLYNNGTWGTYQDLYGELQYGPEFTPPS